MFLEYFEPPAEEPAPIVGDPPIPWAGVQALLEWLDRPEAPVCAHTYKDTIHFLLDQDLPVNPLLRWLHACGGFCDCKVGAGLRARFPHHFEHPEGGSGSARTAV